MGWVSCSLTLCKCSGRGELACLHGRSSPMGVEGGDFSRQCCLESLFTANIFLCCEMMADLELLQQLFAFLRKISVVHL